MILNIKANINFFSCLGLDKIIYRSAIGCITSTKIVIFSIGSVFFLNAFFGQGTGQIVLDNVLCYGSEPRIYDCASANGLIHSSCGHDDDAGVRCQPLNTSMSQLYTAVWIYLVKLFNTIDRRPLPLVGL